MPKTGFPHSQVANNGKASRYVKHVVLLGHPVSHSVSPAFQQAAFDNCDVPFRYSALDVSPADLESTVRSLRGSGFRGANVTIPYKEKVQPYLDDITPLAHRVGSVNTVINNDGLLLGDNTDVAGFIKALNDVSVDVTDGKALILGAGGAARAVAFALAEAKAPEVVIANRGLARAQRLINDLQPALESPRMRCIHWDDICREAESCHLIVNCTSLGLRGGDAENQSPLQAEFIPKSAVIFDVEYNPPHTPFLMEADKAGATIISGLSMLVYQGALSFKLWTGLEAPLDIMFDAARKALPETRFPVKVG
ncbi:MAG: shikimate dehydrogenase [Chloroflexota bacterium]